VQKLFANRSPNDVGTFSLCKPVSYEGVILEALCDRFCISEQQDGATRPIVCFAFTENAQFCNCGTLAVESCLPETYFHSMRIQVSITRKIVAMMTAAILLLATEPAALAMPATPMHHTMQPAMMQMMGCTSHESRGCDHVMPQHERGAPCKDMANCLGMLSCIALAAVPHNAATIMPLALTATQSWRLYDIEPGITLQPDNPPPIA